MSQRDDETERLAKFRAMAEEARGAALNAKSASMRAEYEALVRAWELLIAEMEAIDTRQDGAAEAVLHLRVVGGGQGVDD